MAINRTSITADDIRQNYDVAIQILSDQPDTSATLATPVTPNVLVGFYNNSLDVVELYITSASGLNYIRVK